MKRFNSIATYLVFALAAVGCTSTGGTPFKEPAPEEKTFKKLSLYSTIKNPRERSLIEGTLSSELAKHGFAGVPFIEIFPPDRTYDAKDVERFLKKESIDGILIIKLMGKERRVETSYDLSLDVFENKWQDAGKIGYEPRVYFLLELHDVSTGRLMWSKLTFSAGNAYDGAHAWVGPLAAAAVKELQGSGLLHRLSTAGGK